VILDMFGGYVVRMTTRVLVTGASGRTGRAIFQALARASSCEVPVTVRAFVRKPAQWPTIAALGASEHAVGDMADAAQGRLSQDDMARILGEVLGRPVTARAVPLEEMRAKARTAGLGEDRIEQMTAMNRHYDAHGMRGNPNVLRMLLGREPTTFRQYVEHLARRR
jgi:uncharacterized protein YbjT (DUF2867 family)